MVTDEQFVYLLKEARLSPQQIGDALSVSRPTVERWLKGENLPYGAMREPIVEFLSDTFAQDVLYCECEDCQRSPEVQEIKRKYGRETTTVQPDS